MASVRPYQSDSTFRILACIQRCLWPKSHMEELGNSCRYPGQPCPNPNTNSNPRGDLETEAARKTPPHEGQGSKTGLLMLSHLAKEAFRSQKDPGGKMLRPERKFILREGLKLPAAWLTPKSQPRMPAHFLSG